MPRPALTLLFKSAKPRCKPAPGPSHPVRTSLHPSLQIEIGSVFMPLNVNTPTDISVIKPLTSIFNLASFPLFVSSLTIKPECRPWLCASDAALRLFLVCVTKRRILMKTCGRRQRAWLAASGAPAGLTSGGRSCRSEPAASRSGGAAELGTIRGSVSARGRVPRPAASARPAGVPGADGKTDPVSRPEGVNHPLGRLLSCGPGASSLNRTARVDRIDCSRWIASFWLARCSTRSARRPLPPGHLLQTGIGSP